MFSDYGKQLLKTGIIEAKAGNRESARRYLDRAVYISSDHDALAEAWFWINCLPHPQGYAARTPSGSCVPNAAGG